jgi:hypothetical protein
VGASTSAHRVRAGRRRVASRRELTWRLVGSSVAKLLERYLLAAALLVLVGGLTLGAVLVLPSRTPIVTPLSPTIIVSAGSATVGVVRYSVRALPRRNRWLIVFSLTDDVDRSALVQLTFQTLPGATFGKCASCENDYARGSRDSVPMNLRRHQVSSQSVEAVGAAFGYSTNGVNASAALPELLYTGARQPSFYTYEGIPGANHYSWTGVAPEYLTSQGAQWSELSGSAPGPGQAIQEVNSNNAAGIDHEAQGEDEHLTLLAGALLGGAGAAAIAALQEATPLLLKDLTTRRRRRRTEPEAAA